MTTRSSLRPQVADYAHLEPLPDPEREHDMEQFKGIITFAATLIPYFAHRDDVLISGEGYLRHEATNDAERLAPDCVVTFGVNPEGIIARNGYVISEVGKPPDFVLEVASRSTGRRDYTVKREGYAAIWSSRVLALRPHGRALSRCSVGGRCADRWRVQAVGYTRRA